MFSLIKKDEIKTKPTAPTDRTCKHYEKFANKSVKTITSNRSKKFEAEGNTLQLCTRKLIASNWFPTCKDAKIRQQSSYNTI